METNTQSQLSVLKDIAQAGSSHAAIALSQLLNRTVHLKNNRIEWLTLSSLSEIFKEKDAGIAALSFRIFGDARGNILIFLNNKDAQSLIEQLAKVRHVQYPFVNDFEVSAIKEAGNILAGAYLNAVCNITNLVLLPSVPALFQDTFSNSLNSILKDWNLKQEKVLVLETELLTESRITCYFCLIPGEKFLDLI